MKKYKVFIDVAQTENWVNINVESMEVEAFNCNDAYMKANRHAQELYDNFYVWEVTEDDVIN